MNQRKLILAIDKQEINEAKALCELAIGKVGFVKLGMEFFYSCGAEGVNEIAKFGIPIFLDLKLHDIPNTVAKACTSLLAKVNGVEILTLHASGGVEMLKWAKEATLQASLQNNKKQPMLFGVTVLTSTSEEKDIWHGLRILFPFALVTLRAIEKIKKLTASNEVQSITFAKQRLKVMVDVANNTLVYWKNIYKEEGERLLQANKELKENPLVADLGLKLECDVTGDNFYKRNILSGGILNQVLHLANNAKMALIEGIVCSPLEAHFVKTFFPELKIITPGIRPEWYSVKDDQSRTLTPKQALQNGADYLVIGRPITASPSPLEALEKTLLEIA